MPTVRWNNGCLVLGPLLERSAVGIQLSWGRRDMLEGRPLGDGEPIFADSITVELASMHDAKRFGTMPAIIRRAFFT